MSAGTVSAAELDAARLILGRMGITPEDLFRDPDRAQAPTFAEYVPVVSAAVSAGTRRVYGSYWNRLVEHWGTRRLDEPTPSEVKQLSEYVRTHVVKRRNGRGGRGASEHLIAALRCLYNHAIADGVIREADNPAGKVAKPHRLQSTRRAVPPDRIAEINHAAASSGNDPQLDTLILRIHQETACRRGGALALTPADLDPDQCLVLLKEKGDTQRWQPVSPTLMRHLLAHATERGVPANERLLRALLRSRIGGQADAPLRRLSDCLGEFGKRHGDSKLTRSFGRDFVVAATQVLHEGESGDDDRGRAVGS